MTNITFNLDNWIINFIKAYSMERKISQKELIEESIKKIQIEEMKKSIRKESKELWKQNENEFLKISESWLNDYNIWLKILENEK